MKSTDFFKLIETDLEKVAELKNEADIYELEKKPEEQVIEMGRELMQELIGQAGNDHRVKKKDTRFGETEVHKKNQHAKSVDSFNTTPYFRELLTYKGKACCYGQAEEAVNRLLRRETHAMKVHRITNHYGQLAETIAVPKAKMPSPDDSACVELSPNANFLGGEACVWATEQGLIERRIYPRILSMAERVWSDSTGSLANLEERYKSKHQEILRKLGVWADEAAPKQTLFDGKNTEQWESLGNPALEVKDGEWIASSKNMAKGWLRSKNSYRNFVLNFDYWTPVQIDQTGVYIGCDSGSKALTPQGQMISTRAPTPIDEPAGGFDLATRQLYPAQNWNRYELVVRGEVATLTVGERLVWSSAHLKLKQGVIGITPPAKGVKYRAITIRPLP